MGILIIKIRRSWDRLIFIMGIPILLPFSNHGWVRSPAVGVFKSVGSYLHLFISSAYPNQYANGSSFVVFCCDSAQFKVTHVVQHNFTANWVILESPRAYETTVKNIGKYITWCHKKFMKHSQQNKAQQNLEHISRDILYANSIYAYRMTSHGWSPLKIEDTDVGQCAWTLLVSCNIGQTACVVTAHIKQQRWTLWSNDLVSIDQL